MTSRSQYPEVATNGNTVPYLEFGMFVTPAIESMSGRGVSPVIPDTFHLFQCEPLTHPG
jgi:hypothetical protein